MTGAGRPAVAVGVCIAVLTVSGCRAAPSRIGFYDHGPTNVYDQFVSDVRSHGSSVWPGYFNNVNNPTLLELGLAVCHGTGRPLRIVRDRADASIGRAPARWIAVTAARDLCPPP